MKGEEVDEEEEEEEEKMSWEKSSNAFLALNVHIVGAMRAHVRARGLERSACGFCVCVCLFDIVDAMGLLFLLLSSFLLLSLSSSSSSSWFEAAKFIVHVCVFTEEARVSGGSGLAWGRRRRWRRRWRRDSHWRARRTPSTRRTASPWRLAHGIVGPRGWGWCAPGSCGRRSCCSWRRGSNAAITSSVPLITA